jgi:hypothetical protein
MNDPTGFRRERIDKLLYELEYEILRGIAECEIDEHMDITFVSPRSNSRPGEVVFCQFKMKPLPWQLAPSMNRQTFGREFGGFCLDGPFAGRRLSAEKKQIAVNISKPLDIANFDPSSTDKIEPIETRVYFYRFEDGLWRWDGPEVPSGARALRV